MQPITYFPPLEKAFGRMKRSLFKPFNFTKWLALAFTAWLANLCEGGNGGTGGGNFNLPSGQGGGGGPDFSSLTQKIGSTEIAIIVAVAVVVLLLAVTIGLVVTWINSRGKFMFLDNVVHNRALVADPWRRFHDLGNSLFLWRLGFFVVGLAAAMALGGLVLLAAGGFSGFGFASARNTIVTLLAILLAFVFVVAVAYVSLFLDSFVVPIMYKSNLTATAAWAAFLPWVERCFGPLFLYGLFVLAFWVAVGLCVVAAGLFTCCVVFLLLIIPYVGTVILLPVLVTYRSFSLEFLAQLDPGFEVFPGTREAATVGP